MKVCVRHRSRSVERLVGAKQLKRVERAFWSERTGQERTLRQAAETIRRTERLYHVMTKGPNGIPLPGPISRSVVSFLSHDNEQLESPLYG